jgi:hypothetical protein
VCRLSGSKSYYANLSVRPQDRLPKMFHQDDPSGGVTALSSLEVRHLSLGNSQSPADVHTPEVQENMSNIARFPIPR